MVAFEWFAHAVCFTFANSLSTLFFPNLNSKTGLFVTYCLFLIPFLGRPIGAYLFGLYSDKYGRAKSAYYAFLLMFVSTLALVFVPSFSYLGYFSAFIFTFIRFFQGIGIAGSYGITVMNVENAHKAERYFSSSILSLGFMFGFLLGNAFGFISDFFFSKSFAINYGWRIPLFINALLSVPILYYFSNNDFNEEVVGAKKTKTKLNWNVFLKACLVICLDMFCFHVIFVYLPNYRIVFLEEYASFVYLQTFLSILIMFLLTPFFGKVADAYGGVFNLKLSAFLLALASFFGPWNSYSYFWAVFFGVTFACCYGSLYAWVAMQFEPHLRARASGMVVNLMAVLVGGFSPIFCSFLANYNFQFISYSFCFVCILILFVLYKSKNRNLM